MNYLKITNKGLICPEDLMLIGSSTKRGQDKIGMFGSGWKYALAWLLRNDCAPLIFSGQDEIKIDFTVSMHRASAVNIITVNGRETSLTTEMGCQWSGWMAIREILSNAIDEGEHAITTEWLPKFQGHDDVTTVYLPMNNELSEVMMKFDSYFSFNRKPVCENKYGKLFIKTKKSTVNVYRRGIRCFDCEDETIIDFDGTNLDIDESRLTQPWYINQQLMKFIKEGISTSLLTQFLSNDDFFFRDGLPTKTTSAIMESLKELLAAGKTFTCQLIMGVGGIFATKPNDIILPNKWYEELETLGLVPSLFERFGTGNEVFHRTDAKNVDAIKYLLKGMGIDITIHSGKCNSEVFVNDEKAYIKDCTKYSDKTLAAMIVKRMPQEFYERILS